MSKRFIITNLVVQENKLFIHGEEVNHINVLRHKIGDRIYVNDYEIEILDISKEKLEGAIIGLMPDKGVPKTYITLIQSYLKSDKMDYVVQKAVELGAKTIIPVITKNTRLSKIAKEAVQQCGRTDVVNVENIQLLKELDFNEYDIVLICHEVSNVNLKETLNKIQNKDKIALVIGPEGGLDNSEVESLLELDNVQDISLGDRILRAETASLAALSILSYELE